MDRCCRIEVAEKTLGGIKMKKKKSLTRRVIRFYIITKLLKTVLHKKETAEAC